MTRFMSWIAVPLSVLISSGSALATNTVAAGTIESIDATNKSFVLVDAGKKVYTFRFAEDLTVNRGGKEGKNDLKAGDVVHVCYDKGILNWTSHYILVLDGASKTQTLIKGTFKSYDPATKEMTFTDEAKTDTTYPVGKATIRFNMKEGPIADSKIGDQALIIVDSVSGKSTLKALMIERTNSQ